MVPTPGNYHGTTGMKGEPFDGGMWKYLTFFLF